MEVRTDGLGVVEELQQDVASLCPSGLDLRVLPASGALERLEGFVGLLEHVR